MRSTALTAEQRRLFGRSSGHSRRHSSRPSGRHGSASRSSQTTTRHAYGRSTKRQMITIHAICLSDHQQSIPPSRETKLKLSWKSTMQLFRRFHPWKEQDMNDASYKSENSRSPAYSKWYPKRKKCQGSLEPGEIVSQTNKAFFTPNGYITKTNSTLSSI